MDDKKKLTEEDLEKVAGGQGEEVDDPTNIHLLS